MSEKNDKGPLLGQQVSGSASYAPDLLFPVPRENARRSLQGEGFKGFGEDVWHAYELSWLSSDGQPQMFLGTFVVPASSQALVESKSLKLYLNSLNGHSFPTAEHAKATIEDDVGKVVGAPVTLLLSAVDAPAFCGVGLPGECLDSLQVGPAPEPDLAFLRPMAGDDIVYTHCMRSLCPVTAQPDWATVIVEMRGNCAAREGLLTYLLAFRDHQEFHEQCVERIFTDIQMAISPSWLSVQALYTRRGGLDICPWRCSEERSAPRWRINRQ